MTDLEIKIVSYVPAIAGVIITGLFVLLNNTRSVRNRLFFLFNATIAAWLISLFIADTTTVNDTALWFLRFGLFFGQLIFAFFYLFALEFPFGSPLSAKMRFIWSVPTIFLAFALLTPLGVVGIEINNYGVQPTELGIFYTFSDIVGIAYLIAGAVILFRKRRRSTLQQRSQIDLVLCAVALVLIANVFTGIILTLLQIDSQFIWIGSFSLFVFSLIIAYAMVRHRFFDIRPIVARAFAYILLVAVLSGIYAIAIFGGIGLFLQGDNDSLIAQFVLMGSALLMAFSFQPLRKIIDQFSNKLFYRDAYDPQEFLSVFNKSLVTSMHPAKLIDSSTQIIGATFKPDFMTVYLHETPHVPEFFNGSKNQDGLHKAVKQLHHLTEDFTENTISIDTLADQPKHHRLMDLMKRYKIAMIIRLSNNSSVQKSEVGFMFLGYKRSGSPFSSQDIKVFEIVSNELVIAIQNALRFEEIEAFSETLQKEVEDATRQLRHSNEKLKQLDETKDDFISMASHQLRTPLTSIKGYISMVLDGDAGKISPLQSKLLGQAFISSQRMVYLISDLLNVSRLRTGKFIVEPTVCNLAEIVEEEVKQLVETASGRNLTLEYHKPSHFPLLMLDETKMRQVIMNFIDNAIYYTPAGGTITVGLKELPKTVEFTVTDTGIGVPKAEQHHLFSKFYRAHNAKRARPDGTGLGLFMARKVILSQGGATIFRSQEGKGSVFGFTFSKAKLEPTEGAPSIAIGKPLLHK